MATYLSKYNYSPLFDLRKSDFIDLRTNLQEFIPFGEDNMLPSQLNRLSREVPVHRAILNSKSNYIIGKGLACTDTFISEFILAPNNSDLNLNMTLRRIVFDYLCHGNAYIEIVTDSKKSFFFLYHCDASKVRIAASADSFIIHPNWEEYKGKNDPNSLSLPGFPNFEKGADKLFHSLFHIKDYEPEFYFYGLCSYFAGLRSIIISGLTNVWNQRRLERQFTAPGLLIIPGVNDDTEAESLDSEFQKYMGSGSEKAAEIIIQYLQDLSPGQASQSAQYIEFLKKEEGNWLALHQQAEASLITIHNWFRSLTPYSDDKSGFDKNKIIAEYEIAMSSIIRPHQELFLSHLAKIFSFFGQDSSTLEFLNEPPVSRINPFKFVWEVRRDAGLTFNPADPIQCQLVIQVRNTFNPGASDSSETVSPLPE